MSLTKERDKNMTLQTKLIMVGIVLVTVFNPLSVNLWSDALVIALNYISGELVKISTYTTLVGATLIIVGGLITYSERDKKETKRLRSLKNKKSKTQEYIEA